jgi:hypothetical protein
MSVTYADVEDLAKTWLATTTVAPLLVRLDGGHNIFLAMPVGAPLPAITLARVGGGPRARKDLPEDRARLSFQCWGTSRASAGVLARTLVAELDTLARTGGWTSGPATLGVDEIVTVLWLPEPDADIARYIVDALVTTIST